MTVFAIGTCRVYEPAFVARAAGRQIATLRHRFHTLGEVEWGLRYALDPTTVPDELLFTLSDYALETVKKENGIQEIRELDQRARVGERGHFIIEISSPREHFGMIEGREVRINQLVASRIGLTPRVVIPSVKERLKAMRRIRNLVPGRILWVSHANVVDPSPEELGLHRLRGENAEVIQEGARRMGDDFYDPTRLVASMGRQAVFAEDGADLGHFTHEAHRVLGGIYNRWSRGHAAA